MKYIDADLLRKEIEYLKTVHIGHAAITKETNAVDGLDAALQVIDSLPEEKPSEDFPTSDEEMAKFLATHPKVEVPEKYKTPNWLFDKQSSEDLEEAAEKWCKENGRGFVLRDKAAYYIGETLPAFIAGAEWQKNREWKPSDEQMMELQHGIDFIENEWGDDEPVLRSLYEDLKKLKED